jgi:hypothetical protein
MLDKGILMTVLFSRNSLFGYASAAPTGPTFHKDDVVGDGGRRKGLRCVFVKNTPIFTIFGRAEDDKSRRFATGL